MGYHLERAGYEIKLFDVLKLQAGPLVTFSAKLHGFINRYLPSVWKWLYTSGAFTDLTLSSRVKVAGRNYHHVKEVIDQFRPDIVITTQTSASAVIQYLKDQGWYKGLFAIAFSDYHLHRYWLYDAADLYLVNIEEQKQEMIQLGVSADKIVVIGMTLKERPVIDAAAVRARLRIDEQDNVVLVASGSLGIGFSKQWFVNLTTALSAKPHTKLIIVCGKNEALVESLRASISSDKVLIMGYYTPLAELYAISDVFLTKPGGLTVAETLQWQLPILVTHWLPGQEEINYYYLLNKRLVLAKPASVKPGNLLPEIVKELSNRSFRKSLNSNPEALELIQSGKEGKSLISAVRALFHEV